MSGTRTLGERGQVTIPKAIRDRLGLRKGAELEFELTDDGVTIRRRRPDSDPVWRVFGRLNRDLDVDQFLSELRDE